MEVRHEAPKVPAKNLKTIKASKLVAPQQAALNAVKAVKVVQNMIRRPKTSEHGAHINGPTTKPRTKPDVTVNQYDLVGGEGNSLMIYISELYPGKSFRISRIAALIILLAIATPRTASAPITTFPHLYDCGH